MKTKKIAAVGGPNSGKSVFASLLYAELRILGVDARYVQEYATDYIAEHGSPKDVLDQLRICERQVVFENRFSNSCQIVLVESPAFITGLVYAPMPIYKRNTLKKNSTAEYQMWLKKAKNIAVFESLPTFDIILHTKPVWPYKKDGIRIQKNKKEALDVERRIQEAMREVHIPYFFFDNRDSRIRVSQAMELLKGLGFF